jgi:hypothetical protein
MLLVFTGEEYYPGGGWSDFQGTADSIDAARAKVESVMGNDDWYHIVDASSLKIVEEGSINDVTTYDPYEEKRQAVPAAGGEGYHGV